MTKKEWFAEWFDTPYYHTLYKHRDDEEAEAFIGRLLTYLNLKKGTKVLDLACGKGRHSRTLHSMGMDVLGVDLSKESIREASNYTKDGLSFDVHDMREVYRKRHFDVVFNLFTSFGYFDTLGSNEKVLQSIHEMLNPEGELIIDFMNVTKVVSNLVEKEEKTIDSITFYINRSYNGHHIKKDIRFHDAGNDFHFTERVQALNVDDFEMLLKATGFELIRTFGDFTLKPFDNHESDRLIIHAKRI